jgi:hypothetical protein
MPKITEMSLGGIDSVELEKAKDIQEAAILTHN